MNTAKIEEILELVNAIIAITTDEYDEDLAIVDEIVHQLRDEIETLQE